MISSTAGRQNLIPLSLSLGIIIADQITKGLDCGGHPLPYHRLHGG